MYICVYICMYVYVYIYIIYMFIYISTHLYKYTYTNIQISFFGCYPTPVIIFGKCLYCYCQF